MVSAEVMKLANMRDSKSRGVSLAGSSPALGPIEYSRVLAYVVGVAIGDGNLSNPNGRAVRLRITCDAKYPNLIQEIKKSIQLIFPSNKVSLVNRADTYLDISCYSNQWEKLLGWKVGRGSKVEQNVTVPDWIKDDVELSRFCLKGLIETDGSIYIDRGYKMVNFVTVIPSLANDVLEMIRRSGFQPHLYQVSHSQASQKDKYTVRVSKNTDKFIELIGFNKT